MKLFTRFQQGIRMVLEIWSIILCIIIFYVMVYLRMNFMMKKILIAFMGYK